MKTFQSYLRWAAAEIIEYLLSRRESRLVFVRRDVDGVVLGQLHSARGAEPDKRVRRERRGVRLRETRGGLSTATGGFGELVTLNTAWYFLANVIFMYLAQM